MYHQISQYKILLCVCPQLGRLSHPLQSRNSLKTLKLLSLVCLSCAQISETQAVEGIGIPGLHRPSAALQKAAASDHHPEPAATVCDSRAQARTELVTKDCQSPWLCSCHARHYCHH